MTAETEFKMERVFKAPIDLVWRAWTEPELMDRWFGPPGCATQMKDFTFAPGGTAFYEMRFGEAPPMFGKYIYEIIEPPNFLSWRHGFADADGNLVRHPADPNWPLLLRCEVWFSAHKTDETRMVFIWAPVDATAEERAAFAAGSEGAYGGWTASFNQLDALLETVN